MEARASPPVLAIGERDGLPLNQRNQALLKNPLKNFSVHCASATPRPIPSRPIPAISGISAPTSARETGTPSITSRFVASSRTFTKEDRAKRPWPVRKGRSEEHTSELQSHY